MRRKLLYTLFLCCIQAGGVAADSKVTQQRDYECWRYVKNFDQPTYRQEFIRVHAENLVQAFQQCTREIRRENMTVRYSRIG